MQSIETLKTRLAKAKTSLILEHPFIGSIALGMPHTYQEGIGTACTNGKRVQYSPAFVSDLTDEELKFLVAHECMHPMLEHNFRRQSRDPRKWNIAADYVINQLLVDEGIGKFIEGGCLNKALYDAGGGMSEQIYTLLPESNDDGDGGGGDGGVGGIGQDLEDGEGTQQDQAQQAAEWRVKVAQAAQAAKMMGKLSAGMERLVDGILNPTVDWREVLQRFVVKFKTDDRSFSRPNRRFLSQGMYLPSRSGEVMGPIAFFIDCSGSVDDAQLAQMAAEVRTVHETLRPEKLHVVYFDSVVSHYDCFGPDDDVKINFHGGGGTDVRAAFDYLDTEGHADEVLCAVVLTDGYTPYPEGANYPVIWAMTTDMQAPFGDHCKVEV
jgi:predicted metal-dependent peptidase